jgi:lysophospholipase L1-like esterase
MHFVQRLSIIAVFALPAGAAATLHIMPLGDSITAGYSGTTPEVAPGGYRNHLYSGLKAAGIKFEFDGTSTQNPSPLLLSARQERNQGASGFLIRGIPLASYPGGFYPGLYESLDGWFREFRPDIVLLMIGTNDINMDVDLANAPARLGDLLDKITANDRKCRIVLSTLIYTLDPKVNPKVTAYNAALPAVAASRPNVTLVDNSKILDLTTDYASDLHPNRQGYDKLGDALADEVLSLMRASPAK